MRMGRLATACSLLLGVACGGSQPPAESAAEPERTLEPAPAPEKAAEAADATEAPKDEPARALAEAPEPEFKENGSVDDAIAAVPVATKRYNIEQEALARPLQDFKVYEPCKPGNGRFKFRVAIWNGKAVGLDMSSTPKNAKLEQCIAQQIRALTWPDKVRALNTVEYQF
jgi:hypothetical protein